MDRLRAGMADTEILAHYRRIYPHMSLSQAKEVYRTWLQFRHLGAVAERKQREAADAERRRLRERLFGVDDGSEATGQTRDPLRERRRRGDGHRVRGAHGHSRT
jgi:hypothetical protein